ncbi:DUF1330 domain-containing protein [Ancylobacter sp. WKF20]|uniref:DUF1330 domain-containing protein n=1 Tax=Ancylobacter sp. WKF20 TaxID=3039801 RepID=UPI00243416D5|nr:DUF1330 domain-containing protein [Ancylobacter sp. WKF20]WGD29736.1 DUF1330 domain-containing protein [Ancylobacter sp. WKF20]
MTAYFIAHGTVKDPEKLQLYIERAGPYVAAAGGEFVSTGELADVLIGEHTHKRISIFRFPDAKAARSWFDTEEYQGLRHLRNEAADFTFLVFEETFGPN